MPGWIQTLLGHYGYSIVFLAVLLNELAPPIPGETLLLGAGWLCADGALSLGWVITLGAVACFLGGDLGYWMGRRVGWKIIRRSRWLRSKPERIDWTRRFLKKNGAKAVFFARLVSLMHPVTGLFAGIFRVRFRPFLVYNLLGSTAYAAIYASLGYFFGESWEIAGLWLGRAALYGLAVLLTVLLLATALRRPLPLLMAHLTRRR